MTEEDIIISEQETYDPDPEPTPEPVPDPEPAPGPEPAPAPDPVPDPEPEVPAAPVEVVTVEDLLDRLTGDSQEDGDGDSETEGPSQGEGTEDGASGSEGGASSAGTAAAPLMEIFNMDKLVKSAETIQGAVDHPMLTTPFEDYTVTEGILLLLLLSVFVSACVKLLKGGFAWLR